MSYILTSFLTAFIIFCIQRYYRSKKSTVVVYQISDAQLWKNFIEACCNSCTIPDHCRSTYQLLKLFKIRFNNELPSHLLNEWIENLSNLIDKKYKAVVASGDPTEITVIS